MDIFELWDKSIEEIEDEISAKLKKPKIHQNFADLKEKIQYFKAKDKNPNFQYYDDIMSLNNEKFFKRLSKRSIIPHPTMFIGYNSNLAKQNVEVLNSMSDELLDKMSYPETHKLPMISPFLTVSDLDERVSSLENFRLNSPKLFENMQRSEILDYLLNSNLYSDSNRVFEQFHDLYETQTEQEDAKIIQFPRND